MMKELIGMEDVKKQVINVVNVMKYNRIREKMGISSPEKQLIIIFFRLFFQIYGHLIR